jgi:hypothetical protein
VAGVRSGAFATDDYYIRPVDKGHIRNPGNRFIQTDGGIRVARPSPSYALAGALWDPHGTWGAPGTWFTYDDPFLTHGGGCVTVAPPAANGTSCTGTYYGAMGFVLDQANPRWDPRMPIEVTRFDAAGVPVGTWSVADGNLISAFQNMRHFAARAGAGRFLLDFPASSTPADVGLELENLLEPSDTFVLGVRFDGADPAQVYTTTAYQYFNVGFETLPPTAWKHDYASVGSLAEVIASPGEVFWQDVANDVVWIRVRGGLEPHFVDPTTSGPYGDRALYERFNLRIL